MSVLYGRSTLQYCTQRDWFAHGSVANHIIFQLNFYLRGRALATVFRVFTSEENHHKQIDIFQQITSHICVAHNRINSGACGFFGMSALAFVKRIFGWSKSVRNLCVIRIDQCVSYGIRICHGWLGRRSEKARNDTKLICDEQKARDMKTERWKLYITIRNCGLSIVGLDLGDCEEVNVRMSGCVCVSVYGLLCFCLFVCQRCKQRWCWWYSDAIGCTHLLILHAIPFDLFNSNLG